MYTAGIYLLYMDTSEYKIQANISLELDNAQWADAKVQSREAKNRSEIINALIKKERDAESQSR